MYITYRSRVLELGCGNGRDSVYLASQGNKVVATDFSEVVIEQNRELFAGGSVSFELLDISTRFGFSNESYDAVYANLAIHYFSDEDTRMIINEIHRVLKPKGLFAFSCKADDSLRKKGAKEIAPDYYIGNNGHMMHFFTKEYATELAGDKFELLHLDQVEEHYVDRTSKITRFVGRKK